MTGLLYKKYRIAVYDPNILIVNEIVRNIKKMFNRSVVIDQFIDIKEMFTALNIAKAKKNPVDIAILGETDGIETEFILHRTNLNMEIIKYKDIDSLKNSPIISFIHPTLHTPKLLHL
jgi:predicted GTPase